MRFLLMVITIAMFPMLTLADQTKRQMTLTGIGEVFVAPDMATIQLGVSSFDKQASAAMKTNTVAMNAVFGDLKNAGIESKDIQTSQLSLNPRWEHKNNQQPRILGYEAANMVTVRIRDLAIVGTVLDVLTQNGANRINGINFGLQNPRPHQDEARKRAVHDAKSKAQLYADAAGVTLGQINSISEANSSPRPHMMGRMAEAMSADAVPIAEGELGLRSNVTIVYGLE